MSVRSATNRFASFVDERVRALAAGIGLRELRAILRGEPPTERPNPRYLAHTRSMVLHIRPRYYQRASTWFTHTFRLGFLTAFLFIIEIITGFILMIYYVPSPEGAYPSILRLMTRVPFGELLRDVHRLAGEGMVVFAFLHMLRTFLTASYREERTFTWLTGVALLLITLLLAFSGYLLPWDQLAYWAVTIGTSMAAAVPFFGETLNFLLRGGENIGADGLLRFYQLHVILLPLLAIVVVSVHYYRVARIHGISLPARIEEGDVSEEEKQDATQKVNLIPDLLTHEVFLTSLGLLVLIAWALYGYDAPLEHHANPLRTPLETEAPWFFLWVQGLLKLGNKTLMGVVVPLLVVGLLFAVPYVDWNRRRMLRYRPLAIVLSIVGLVALVVLSYMGSAEYGIPMPPATQISQNLAPEEGVGPLQRVPFDDLAVGVYEVNKTDVDTLAPAFEPVFTQFEQAVNAAADAGQLPDAQALLIVQDWQADLKQVSLRIAWTPAEGSSPEGAPTKEAVPAAENRITYERQIYLHRARNGGAQADESPTD